MTPRALIAEPSAPVASTLRKYLEGIGFEIQVAPSLEEALQRVQENAPDMVFAAGASHFDGEALTFNVKKHVPLCPVVLLYPPEEDAPEERASKAGADAFLVGPLKRGTVISCARSMLRIRELQATVDRMAAAPAKQAAPAPAAPEPPARSDELPLVESGAQSDFDFFKKYLLMEVKRSRRYRYPIAFLLIALDHFGELTSERPPADTMSLLTEALGIITRSVRDIDLAVPFSEQRFLVFLPHTPREGAMTVASRMRERLAQMQNGMGITASIGVATFEPTTAKGPVSFGSLMRVAAEALKRAQEAGGDRVEAAERSKRSRISIG